MRQDDGDAELLGGHLRALDAGEIREVSGRHVRVSRAIIFKRYTMPESDRLRLGRRFSAPFPSTNTRKQEETVRFAPNDAFTSSGQRGRTWNRYRIYKLLVELYSS